MYVCSRRLCYVRYDNHNIYIAYLNDDNKQKSCLKTLKADWHSQLGNAGKLIKILKTTTKFSLVASVGRMMEEGQCSN